MDKEKERMRELRLTINYALKEAQLDETNYEMKLSLFGLVDVWRNEWNDIKRKRQYRANRKYNNSKSGQERNRERALKRYREKNYKAENDKELEVDKGLVVFW